MRRRRLILTCKKYLVRSAHSLTQVGHRIEVSSFVPRFRLVCIRAGGAGGATTARIYDILGCGVADTFSGTRAFLEIRFGELKVLQKSSVHWGMELN